MPEAVVKQKQTSGLQKHSQIRTEKVANFSMLLTFLHKIKYVIHRKRGKIMTPAQKKIFFVVDEAIDCLEVYVNGECIDNCLDLNNEDVKYLVALLSKHANIPVFKEVDVDEDELFKEEE